MSRPAEFMQTHTHTHIYQSSLSAKSYLISQGVKLAQTINYSKKKKNNFLFAEELVCENKGLAYLVVYNKCHIVR